MHNKDCPKINLNEKISHNLHKVGKIHLFYRLYYVFWNLSKTENNFGGKSTGRPSYICDTNILHLIYKVNVWDFMFVLETFSK